MRARTVSGGSKRRTKLGMELEQSGKEILAHLKGDVTLPTRRIVLPDQIAADLALVAFGPFVVSHFRYGDIADRGWPWLIPCLTCFLIWAFGPTFIFGRDLFRVAAHTSDSANSIGSEVRSGLAGGVVDEEWAYKKEPK
jgi:hypothetical protein